MKKLLAKIFLLLFWWHPTAKRFRQRQLVEKAIKILVAEKDETYSVLEYLHVEDIITNEFGEEMFIFDHKLNPPTPHKQSITDKQGGEARL